MRPKTLSASAASVYESCPARYNAEYIERIPDVSTDAADKGTCCHAVLETYVKDGFYTHPDLKVLLNLLPEIYDSMFTDRRHFDECASMLTNWFERTDLLDGRKILSTEKKSTFNLPTSAGGIPVTYIFDRCDQHPDGSIEVVDYKSVSQPIRPEDLKGRIQPRTYALAAAIEYKALQPPAIWVSYDLLRYDLVGVRFTRDEINDTWNYFKGLAERILADDGTTEKLNPECRWCVRKTICTELIRHVNGGGNLMYDTLDEAADRRAVLTYARDAISAQMRDLDEFILAEAERTGTLDFTTDTTEVNITVQGRRQIDTAMAARVLTPELFAQYGSLTIGAVDLIMKDKTLDPETRAQLKSLIRKVPSAPMVKVKPRSPVTDDA